MWPLPKFWFCEFRSRGADNVAITEIRVLRVSFLPKFGFCRVSFLPKFGFCEFRSRGAANVAITEIRVLRVSFERSCNNW